MNRKMLQAKQTFKRMTVAQSSVTITYKMLKSYLTFAVLAKNYIFLSESFVKNSETLP